MNKLGIESWNCKLNLGQDVHVGFSELFLVYSGPLQVDMSTGSEDCSGRFLLEPPCRE